MGVGDEDLPFILKTDLVEEVMHPVGVQFLENIIEQQQGRKAFGLFEQFVLRQFQGKQQAFALALGSN